MITFEPGPNRAELGFESAVLSSFDWLASEGFRRVHSDATTVRYERWTLLGLNGSFVSIHHGHGSYELSVWIGRRRPAKHKVDLMEIVTWAGAEKAEGIGKHTMFQVSPPEHVKPFVARLAELANKYAGPFLRGEKNAFEAVLRQRQEQSQAYERQVDLDRMREKAELAWHCKDFGMVVNLYQPFAGDLKLLETKRLEYAMKQTMQTRSH